MFLKYPKRNSFNLLNSFLIITLIYPFIDCRPKFNANYVSVCDENYEDYKQSGYQIILEPDNVQDKLADRNTTAKYLFINDVKNLKDCVKQCCLNEFKCDFAFFNHSSSSCLHVICNSTDPNLKCPLLKKDDHQPTSILQIRSPSPKASIKYRNELSNGQLINQFGFIEQKTNELTTLSPLVLRNKNLEKNNSNKNQIKKLNDLTVVVNENVILQLPNNSVTINAFVHPASNQYNYKWTLVQKPVLNKEEQDTASWEEASSSALKLNNLKQGVYKFNLTVSTQDNLSTGQASVNITVLPPKRINKKPIAIIKPNNSTVQLPKQEIILDGGDSIDDDHITYKWSILKAPIGFELPSNDLEKSTLQIKNLIAGKYVLELTVKDQENETSTAQANILVLKEIDYPPVAAVSQDKIIFLPNNNIVLYGNESTDDKKIVSYDWSLVDENGSDKPINNMDMSGVKTPFLHLSNLEVGVYKFVLKVTDSSNQTSSAETHVFVKPEIDIKPEANAGVDQQIYMPLKENLTLDGSNSKDVSVGGITNWNWSQIQGPRLSLILNPNKPKTNVTNLVPGTYTFLLEITNSKNLTSNSTTKVDIIQNENAPPKADAGGNKTLFCFPCDVVVLNGSRSSDDLIDLKYKWEREPTSLAVGDIIEQSDLKSVLKLTNLIKGRYIFKLTVEDNQGSKSSDIAVLDIKESEKINDFAEILLNVNYNQFKYDQQMQLLKKIEILLSFSDETIKLSNVTLLPIYSDEMVLLRFTAKVIIDNKSLDLPGLEVVKRLRMRLKSDKSLIDPQILKVNTVVCQNACSNHGKCDEKTKECKCDSFWMQNFIRIYLGDHIENCDWSVLYFVIFTFFSFMFICTFIWSFLCFFIRRQPLRLRLTKPRLRKMDLLKKNRSKSRSMKYTLLRPNSSNGNFSNNRRAIDNQTETDSDSEIEHQNRLKKNNQNIEAKIKIKNGNSRMNYKDSSSESEIMYEFDASSRKTGL